MNGLIRTVLGDIAPSELGRTDYHEHLFQISPLLPGEELDDEDRGRDEVALLAASGFDALVDATPLGLGRRPAAIARISAMTGVSVIMTTGAHRREHYGDDHWLVSATTDQLATWFTRDLLDAAGEQEPEAPRRAGMLKCGIGYWTIDAFSRRVIAAVGAAHRASGAPVMVHLEHGSATHEVLDVLQDEGVTADRIVLAHIDRNLDPGLHTDLAARGAYLGYDGVARHREHPDSELIDCLIRVAQAGASTRLLLGGDVARRTRYAGYGGMPGLAYLGDRFIPRLRDASRDSLVEQVLRENPARLLTWS
ncbi:aryldialkylphosphatase [Microbacterium sp.]|uniref:phosphotriesterase family protein n=1 Tax=Microbacterium sp. TaxID=51671 RepID=UPI0025EEA6E7|nr:aryldialkylphosphatase [Microbacterium sp.]